MIRLLCVLTILHGVVFVGAGNALKHLFHQIDAAAAEVVAADAGEHRHHHHHHESVDQVETSEHDNWINCVFCLDGIAHAEIDVEWVFDALPNRNVPIEIRSGEDRPAPTVGFLARAPPFVS